MIHRPLVGALAALVLLGGVASAQTAVPFTTLAQGAHGGMGAPRNVVIRSQAELQQSGVAQLLPAGTQIDFQSEMVIAALMGTQSSGGYGITITGIEREQLMTILPVPGPPPSYVLNVDVSERRPAPGTIVTMALTSPFHVVKLARYRDRVEFRAAPLPFDSIVFQLRNQISGRRIALFKDGSVDSEVRRSPTSGTVRYTGQATAEEQAAVRDALSSARLGSIPTNLTPNPFPLGAKLFTLEVEGGADARKIEGVRGFEGQYASRLAMVSEALEAIATRIEAPQVTEARGIVTVGDDGQVYLNPHKSMSYKVSPADVAATLRRFEGRMARVEGTVTRTGMFSSDVVATRIASPIKSGDLNVELDAQSKATVRGHEVELFGPAARATTVLGRGKLVQVDGWLFEDDAHTPTELFVEALNVRAKANTSLVRQTGTFMAFVPRNSRLKVLNLASGSSRARARFGNRTGYVLTSRLDAEAIIPLHGPTPTTGLTGSVPGQ